MNNLTCNMQGPVIGELHGKDIVEWLEVMRLPMVRPSAHWYGDRLEQWQRHVLTRR